MRCLLLSVATHCDLKVKDQVLQMLDVFLMTPGPSPSAANSSIMTTRSLEIPTRRTTYTRKPFLSAEIADSHRFRLLSWKWLE